MPFFLRLVCEGLGGDYQHPLPEHVHDVFMQPRGDVMVSHNFWRVMSKHQTKIVIEATA